MNSTTVKLLYTNQQWSFFLLFLIFVFSSSLLKEYTQYKAFIHNEITPVEVSILNIYPKKEFNVIKFKTKNFEAFTSVSRNHHIQQLDSARILLISKHVSFLDFLKGFYAQNIAFERQVQESTNKQTWVGFISKQHSSQKDAQLYNALFFALPISQELRQICSNFGISHLIAISGFHLGLISLILYTLLVYPYSFFHQKYFPYRNKKLDILLITALVLLVYLIFTNTVPSLLRAFVMSVLGMVFLRSNIKILSFETLLITVLTIIALFPSYLFSLSLWFSVAGVFYIFLFLHYFKKMNKVGQLLLFNIWIYLSMNPITHYFFADTSYLQLFSPLLTLLFTLFYPLSLLLHLFGLGGFLDEYVNVLYEMPAYKSEVFTPWWFLSVYVVCSFLAIKKRLYFMALNAMMLAFTLYVFYSNIQHYHW